ARTLRARHEHRPPRRPPRTRASLPPPAAPRDPRRSGRRRSRTSTVLLALLLAVAHVLLVDHLLVEREPLVVQQVAEPVALRAEVVAVVIARLVLDRDLVGHAQAVALEPDDLLRVVGEQPNRRQPEVDENLRADPVVAQVGRQPELEI